MIRADLHVHTCHSKDNGNLRLLRSRDCYSDPEDVYRVAKSRGMNIVTITDHDTMDGCHAFLDRHPGAVDFVTGEEISCRMPDHGLEVHVAVYGLDETLHRELRALRGNVFDVCARLRQTELFFAINHLLHFYQPRVPLAEYLKLLLAAPGIEVRNGAMLAAHNQLLERVAAQGGRRWAMVAGSDAHTLNRVGTTWTEAPGVTPSDLLRALRHGRTRAGGRHGGTGAIANDIYGVVGHYVASLAGFGPRDHSYAERAAFLSFAAASLPFQFIPFVVAALTKRDEARKVRKVMDAVAAWPAAQHRPAERLAPADALMESAR